MGCDIHALVERRQTHGSHMPDDLRYEWLNAGDPDLGRDYEMFAALADGVINIALINTSEVRINVATDHDRGQEGLEFLRKTFELPVE